MEHTKEPWSVGELITKNIIGGDDIIVTCLETETGDNETNANRIVACVNACAGMKNPVEEIAELKKQITWRKVKEELPKRDERVWCKDLRGSIRDATFTRHNHAWIFVCSAGYVLDLRNVASWLPIIKETTDD